MTQLRPVFAARCREVAILRAVKVSPRVQYSHVFRRLGYTEIFDLIRAPFFHRLLSCPGGWSGCMHRGGYAELQTFILVSQQHEVNGASA
jgi:hypothetical protein